MAAIESMRDWPHGLHPAPMETRAAFYERCRRFRESQERLLEAVKDLLSIEEDGK